jgi:5'-methylthioadenosine phosphorylase
MKQEGVGSIVSICSTGALRTDISVPGLALPDDYIDLTRFQTFHDDDIHHATPSIDKDLRMNMADALRSMGMEFEDGGVYIQTQGPRLETRAEVRMLSKFGDFVGMNLASEGALCSELGIPFAGLISVDNYANGLVDEELDFRNILKDAKENWNLIRSFLEEMALR